VEGSERAAAGGKGPKGAGPKGFISWSIESKAAYAALVVSFALYLLTRNVVFAIATGLSIIYVFIAESVHSASQTGWRNEFVEIAVTLLVAGGIWVGASFLLQTSAPLDSVVSCSMLPALERGDMVVLQGSSPSAPKAEVSRAQFDSNNWTRQQIVCALCQRANPATGERYIEPCTASTRVLPDGRLEVAGEAGQEGNLLQYECGYCTREYFNGTSQEIPCTRAVYVNGERFEAGAPADTIVYTPQPGDIFAGETIHRVMLALDVEGEEYFFTKGDNNDQLDIQYGNSPIPRDREVGKVVFRIPWLGYLKLFLFGFVSTPSGCDSTLG
jgi:hypothetical protein